MGTSYSVHVFIEGPFKSPPAIADLKQLVEQQLDIVIDAMSTYEADSQISKLNRLPADPATCIPLSPHFYKVLDQAGDIFRRTDGFYDVTLGPLIDLWGFGGKSSARSLHWEPPASEAIQQALVNVGFDKLQLGTDCIRKNATVEVDVSSIAKGYAVDLIAASLRELGLRHFLVEVGGEVYVAGRKQPIRPWLDDQPWRVMIERPETLSFATTQDQLAETANKKGVEREQANLFAQLSIPELEDGTLELSDRAIATSGDYRNYYEYNGKRYSHILDPRSGYPVDAGKDRLAWQLTSVSVIHESTSLADGWATALFAMGWERAKQHARRENLQVILMAYPLALSDQTLTPDDVRLWSSPALNRHLLGD